MSKTIWYIFILILVFLLVSYFKGFTQDVQTTGGVLSRMILYLQGRSDNGQITAYPQG